MSCHSASACHISHISDHRRRSFEVLSIIKMAAAAAQLYYVWFVFGVVTLIKKPKSTIYKPNIVDIWLRYNYFRFRKTNGHIGILLPYSISTLSPISAFHGAFFFQSVLRWSSRGGECTSLLGPGEPYTPNSEEDTNCLGPVEPYATPTSKRAHIGKKEESPRDGPPPSPARALI